MWKLKNYFLQSTKTLWIFFSLSSSMYVPQFPVVIPMLIWMELFEITLHKAMNSCSKSIWWKKYSDVQQGGLPSFRFILKDNCFLYGGNFIYLFIYLFIWVYWSGGQILWGQYSDLHSQIPSAEKKCPFLMLCLSIHWWSITVIGNWTGTVGHLEFNFPPLVT